MTNKKHNAHDNIKEGGLFILFKEYDGLELYEAVKDFVRKEKQITAKLQLDKQSRFATSMMNLWNNAGWDSKKHHSRKLDVIRNYTRQIYDDLIGYNLEEE